MNPAITHEHFQLKKNVPDIRPGDRVRVHQKIREGNKQRVQVFEGLVIKTQHGTGINGTFSVRRLSFGVGVEKNFPLHLPSIVKIEKMRSARVRRAKLFYVRDLIGKRAKRLKKEKEDKAVWEDVAVEEVKKDPEQQAILEGADEATPKPQEKENDKGEDQAKPKDEKPAEANDSKQPAEDKTASTKPDNKK